MIDASRFGLQYISRSSGNPHWDAIITELGPKRTALSPAVRQVRFLFILFTNRCGSNFVAQSLSSTGYFNEAGEFLNSSTILEHCRKRGIGSVSEYLDFLVTTLSKNGLIAFKLAIEHVEILFNLGILQELLPVSDFIFVERQDTLGQAISRVIAWQNLQWTSEHAKAVDDSSLRYDRAWVEEEMRQIQTANAKLIHFLRSFRMAPLHFSYERFVESPQAHLDRVAGQLSLPKLLYCPDLVRIHAQASPINVEWRLRFAQGL